MNLFLSPHNDDEALFGSYIIQTYKPTVVVVTDSYIQFERGEKQCSPTARRFESEAGCQVLGAPVIFLGVADTSDDKVVSDAVINYLLSVQEENDIGLVFAPEIEEDGNWQHNLVGKAADDACRIRVMHYSTYTRHRLYPTGEFPVEYTSEMRIRKLKALECYKSQWSNCCREFFTQESKEEFLVP